VLVLWSVSLEGAGDAIWNHYLHADWTKINIFAADPAVRGEAGEVWAAAFGQIFFTLSLGFGIMITYASYLPDKSDIVCIAVNLDYRLCQETTLALPLTEWGMQDWQNFPMRELITNKRFYQKGNRLRWRFDPNGEMAAIFHLEI